MIHLQRVLANISSSNQFQNTVKLLIKYKQLELKLFATIIPILDPRCTTCAHNIFTAKKDTRDETSILHRSQNTYRVLYSVVTHAAYRPHFRI